MMIDKQKPTYEDLQQRLAEAEAIIASLRRGEADVIVSDTAIVTLRMRDLEGQLRQSEENFRNSMDSSPLGTRIVNSDGGTTYANQAVLDIYGYVGVDELKATPVKERYTSASYDEHKVRKEKRQRGEHVPHSYEISIVRKDGGIRNIQVFRKEVLWDGQMQSQVLYLDVTERKRAEEALRYSEANYSALVEHAREGVLLIQDGLVVLANRALAETGGYTIDELINKPFLDKVAPESRELIVQRYEARLAGKEIPTLYEAKLVAKDGRLADVEISASTMSYQGRPADLIILRDAGPRKRMEEKLRKSEETYRLIVENSRDIIFTLNAEGEFLYVSPSIRDVLGYSQAEAIGQSFRSLIHPEDLPVVEEAIRRSIMEGYRTPGTEYRVRHASGEWRWHISRGSAVRDRAGNFLNFTGIANDMTERKRFEEERQRTDKLESVGFLAGGIAHDFNNLLTGIMGNVGLASRLLGPKSSVSDVLEEAEKACLRATDLTHQLLTFSRGGEPVKTLASIAKAITDSASFALRGSKVKCSFDLPHDLWLAEIDVGQVSQVISNIVINADESMPQGGTISIGAKNVVLGELSALPLPKGRYVEITIADPGIGIPEVLLPKIFDPYFTTKQRGSGLGLATCYSIVKKHRGHITVQSKVGVGTTFHIYLPASEKPIQDRPAEARREASGARGGRILVMDDEEMIRKMVVRLLTAAGYEVEAVSDGAAALERYAKAAGSGRPFDAVILDLTVPGGMGGKEALKRLLEIDPDVKAVVSSGYSTDPIMSDFREYGFCAVMAKPYSVEALGTTLEQVLRGA